MYILLEEYNLDMSCHESCASHVSASSISASTSSKPSLFFQVNRVPYFRIFRISSMKNPPPNIQQCITFKYMRVKGYY